MSFPCGRHDSFPHRIEKFRRGGMNFPEYLKERISEDYKNLIIQKLEEIKDQTEDLKNTISPSLFQTNQSLRDSLQRELARIQEVLESEMNQIQQRRSDQVN